MALSFTLCLSHPGSRDPCNWEESRRYIIWTSFKSTLILYHSISCHCIYPNFHMSTPHITKYVYQVKEENQLLMNNKIIILYFWSRWWNSQFVSILFSSQHSFFCLSNARKLSVFVYMRTHAHMHVRMYACMHMHTHANAYKYKYIYHTKSTIACPCIINYIQYCTASKSHMFTIVTDTAYTFLLWFPYTCSLGISCMDMHMHGHFNQTYFTYRQTVQSQTRACMHAICTFWMTHAAFCFTLFWYFKSAFAHPHVSLIVSLSPRCSVGGVNGRGGAKATS